MPRLVLVQSSTGSRAITELEKHGFLPFPELECPVGGFPTLDNNQMVTSITHMTSGLGFPPSFVLSVLAYYGLELCNLNSSTIVHLSVFVTLCECWLGIAPDLQLFRYFHFPAFYSRSKSLVQSVGFKFRHSDEYIQTAVRSSWKYARD